jgi:hemoglobin/transferrin/lactoferrin receptor protein
LIRILSLLFFVFADPGMTLAWVISDDGDTVQTIFLNNAIVITAQRAETNSFERAESIGYLSKSQLQMLSPMSTPEALANIAGVWMQKTNHGSGSPYIRGLTGYQTLLLVDGIRMNNSTYRSGPNQYLNTIDPLILSHVEVLRGGGSVQYGSDAIGGTIQMLSRDPVFSGDGFRISGDLYGKYWSSDMEMTGRGQINLGSADFAVTGGYTYKNLGDIKTGGEAGIIQPTGYDEYSMDFKAIYRFKNKHQLIAAFQHLNQLDVPLNHKIVTGEYQRYHFNPQQRDLGYLRLISYNDNELISEIRYTVSYQNSLEAREKQKTGSEVLVIEEDEITTGGISIDVFSEITDRWSASSGAEYYHDRVRSSSMSTILNTQEETAMRGLYPDKSVNNNLAFFSLHEYKTQRFNFSGGVRYNFIQLQVSDTLFGNTSITPDAFVGSIGIIYKLNEKHHFVTNLNSAFRAPNINDVSSFGIADFRYEVPSYDLKPETSLNKEIGYKFRSGRASGALHLFHQNLNDLIANVAANYKGLDSLDGYKVYNKENVKEAIIYGGEAELEIKLNPAITAYGNMSYTYGHNLSDDEPLRRIPPLFGRIGLRGYFQSGFLFVGEGLVAGKQVRLASGDISDDRIADGGTPGWVLFNLYAGYQQSSFSINASLQNIFDEAYRIHGSGIDGIGRSFWISLRLHLST